MKINLFWTPSASRSVLMLNYAIFSQNGSNDFSDFSCEVRQLKKLKSASARFLEKKLFWTKWLEIAEK